MTEQEFIEFLEQKAAFQPPETKIAYLVEKGYIPVPDDDQENER